MKSKKQAKAQAKSAKIAAKKAAAEKSMEIEKDNSEKKRKQSLIPKKQRDVKMVEKNKQVDKQEKRDKNEKVTAKKVACQSNETKTDSVKPIVQQSYEETKIHDVQRYLETLPSPEIRDFIEGLIVQDKFNLLTVDIVSAVGDIDRMRYYFQKDTSSGKSRYDPNGRCLDGGTPLHAAIKAKQKETIQLLIENGADLSLVDFMGDNAIMAAIKAGVANMINLLWPYKGNLDVNHQNTVGKTALHLATERSWEGCARFLLSNHAIPDIMDKAGITPLMIAAEKGDMKIVDILIKAGANICLEDEDYDTSVSKALFGNHSQVVDYMLTSLDNTRREFFVKEITNKVVHPPLPDIEYGMPETQYLPILEECTKHGVFRDSFYNQNVIKAIMVKMAERTSQPETVIQICCIVMAIFFRFGKEIDKPFVRQFVHCGGTELVLSIVLWSINEFSFTVKEALQLFLPMIGLAEIQEGRTWLYKNILAVSEFFNHFDKNFLNTFFGKGEYYLWCTEPNYFKEINRVWVHFYNEVHRMQTEQREKHMLALLKEEEQEKYKKEKRLEKIKQKREGKIKKLESNSTSEFLKSWTETLNEETDEEREEDEEEEIVNTCRNTNAFTGLSSDQRDANHGTENYFYNLDDTSKRRIESSERTNPNGGKIFEQLKKVYDEDWTTVQTKKNKDRQTNEKQKVMKDSPLQSSKGKLSPTLKYKKKREVKPKTVSLNSFAKPTVASSPGTMRWADIAKGVAKDTMHIEADDEKFPRPSKVFVNRNKEKQGTDFPSLEQCARKIIKREKPTKMTFHFHSDQPVSSELDTTFNECDDGIIDIEEAEKELQKLEQHAYDHDVGRKEPRKDLCLQMSNTGECFMNDPEYTDDTKPNLFDPTNLTEEEINTFNVRGRVQRKENQPSLSDNYQFEINSANSPNDTQIDTDELKVTQSTVKNAKLCDKRDSEKQLVKDNINTQSDCSGDIYQNRNNIYCKQSRKTIKNKSFDNEIISQNETSNAHDKSKSNTMKRNEKKTLVTTSVSDGSIRLIDRYRNPSMKLPLKTQQSEAEVQILKHQNETCDAFEQQLDLHESEHFMELMESVSPISEHTSNIIDDLFNTPEEIPEWLEDDEEIQKEEEIWDNMTKQEIPIQKSNIIESDTSSQNVPSAAKFINNSDTQKDNSRLKHKSPYDLLSSDPAIIHCIKQQSLVDEISSNFDDVIKKEYVANVPTVNNKDKREETNCIANPFNIEKQTAVIKPLGLTPCIKPAVTNCSFGQKLLETACRLEEAYSSDDSVLYPDNLDGEIYEEDNEQSKGHEGDNGNEGDDESFYFPSFHEETMLSAHHNKNDVSIAHHMQQLQLEQLNNYYMQNKDRITDSATLDHSRFMYYAQFAGINREKIDQYLKGTIELGQMNRNQERKTYPVLPQKLEKKLPKSFNKGDHLQQDLDDNNARQTYQNNIQCQSNELPFQDVRQSPMIVQSSQVQAGQHLVHTPHCDTAASVTHQQVPMMPLVPYGVLVPFPRPQMNPTTIQNIQSQQAAMSSSVRVKIQEILQSMFKSKVKSVRWKNELSKIRSLPPEKLKVIGKIMIPREDNDIICIGRHFTGVTVLGYLSDGSEVAVKIMDCRIRPIKSDELDKLLSIDSAQLFINRYRAIEEFAGYYYIAMDLYEYTLPEYLQIISNNPDIDEKIAVEKLVFQFLRAMLTLHQQYLMIHGELRPENIVIDIDGNLNVSGYGIGRNTMINENQPYMEYDDDDKCWLPPEVLLYKQKVIFKTDIWAVGMLIYYIYKGGKNPFGNERAYIIENIQQKNFMMEYISEEAGNLLSMMLSENKIERPAVADILKHPMFWSEEKKMRFISIVGSDIVRELKQNFFMDKKQRENSMTNIVSMAPCNISLIRWMQAIDAAVMKDMKTYRQYKNSLVDLVVFVYNCTNHFDKLAQTTQDIVEEPGSYFLKKFPTLFMTVYRAVRFSNRKDKTCYKPFF